MTLDEIDRIGLIRESYRIDGIKASQCRSIFLDWALKLPAGVDQSAALRQLINVYATANPDHPMSEILRAGLEKAGKPVRRGGRRARQ